MFKNIKDILTTCVIMLFLYLVFYPIVWIDNMYAKYLIWYYTKHNIPFYVGTDKFSMVVTRLDKQ